MRLKAIHLAAIFLAAGICIGSSPVPFNVELEFVDRIFAATKSQALQQTALGSLMRIAEGHPEAIDARLAESVGLKLEGSELDFLKDSSVRARAIRRIGDTGLRPGLDYLSSIKPGGLGPDDTGQIWPAVQIALRDAQLRQISDPPQQIEFLEKTTEEKSAAQSWAVDELCDRGNLPSLPVIQKSIRSRDSSQRGEDEILFCEARIRVVTSNPDRVKALGSVLHTGQGRPDERLMFWAIGQLILQHSPQADSVLDGFASEISKLPSGVPENKDLYVAREVIQGRPK